jgi:alpha,alpha-trehalase
MRILGQHSTTRVPPLRAARPWRVAATLLFAALLGWQGAGGQQVRTTPDALPSAAELSEVRRYIKQGWTTLTRSLDDLPAAVVDPKMPRPPGEPWPLYVARDEDLARIERAIAAALDERARRGIVLRTLPEDPLAMTDHGLLYLPHPYVVPGGRFNEMYGWDSYFINVGLLLDGEIDRARAMVDNHLYQVRAYGMVLNANRTYYLSRSQPPFLARMVLDVYRHRPDRGWLAQAAPLIDRYYEFWTTAPHLAGDTGLSRYFDLGEGPAPEVVADERDAQGRTHYDRVRAFYRGHTVTDYDVSLFYDRRADALTPLFYKGDRSMRESGFDPSNRFGPFSVDIVSYAPVCLNSLLYMMERDRAEIARLLEGAAEARAWDARADRRRELVDRYLWDEARGLYLDYHVGRGARRHYPFATTFYPLWAGLASPAQARRVQAALAQLEADGGLLTSTEVTGSQWDAPFGWAPMQMIAVAGLRAYGFDEDADRLASKFVALVAKEFREHGAIVEKYDVRRRESDVAAGIRFGYSSNEIGFGWTNAAVLDLLDGLEWRAQQRRKVAAR